MFDVPAYSQDDAQARINKISFAQYVGEHFYTIKVGPRSGLSARLICMIKNVAKRVVSKEGDM